MPVPLYQPTSGSPLSVDTGFYGRLGHEVARRTLVDQLVVPIRTGKAWPVRAGHICRIVTIAGPQVGDLNLWHLHNPREHSGQPVPSNCTVLTCACLTASGPVCRTCAHGDGHWRQHQLRH